LQPFHRDDDRVWQDIVEQVRVKKAVRAMQLEDCYRHRRLDGAWRLHRRTKLCQPIPELISPPSSSTRGIDDWPLPERRRIPSESRSSQMPGTATQGNERIEIDTLRLTRGSWSFDGVPAAASTVHAAWMPLQVWDRASSILHWSVSKWA